MPTVLGETSSKLSPAVQSKSRAEDYESTRPEGKTHCASSNPKLGPRDDCGKVKNTTSHLKADAGLGYRCLRREKRMIPHASRGLRPTMSRCCVQEDERGELGLVLLLSLLGWATSRVAFRYAQHRQEFLTRSSANCRFVSWRASQLTKALIPQCHICENVVCEVSTPFQRLADLFSQLGALDRPNAVTFLLSCTIFTCCYLSLVLRNRHWQHEKSVSLCLVFSVIACVCLESAETILISLTYEYLPIAALTAEIVSLTLGFLHQTHCREGNQVL